VFRRELFIRSFSTNAQAANSWYVGIPYKTRMSAAQSEG
jgi:hypothetical protein